MLKPVDWPEGTDVYTFIRQRYHRAPWCRWYCLPLPGTIRPVLADRVYQWRHLVGVVGITLVYRSQADVENLRKY